MVKYTCLLPLATTQSRMLEGLEDSQTAGCLNNNCRKHIKQANKNE
jgi:hypothetical protein